MKVSGYAATAPDAPLSPIQFDRRDPGPSDVQIVIDYCGICHSDIHVALNEWGRTKYPCVPGHEIVGRVTAVGASVTRHRVGDRVGVGCFIGSCRSCPSCRSGMENLCEAGALPTYAGVEADGMTVTRGGYSTGIVVDEHFVFSIPETLDPASAAPLLCAGITTYSPLRHLGVAAGDRVAVMGLGGLGHVAVQIAASMGAEVTVLSRSPGKKEDASELGAANFVITPEEGSLRPYSNYFHFIIDTVAAEHDINKPLSCLRRDGTLVMLGLPPEPLSVSAFPLIAGRRKLTGSLVGGVPETQEMLHYCAEKGIECEIEMISPERINEAYERTLRGDVKYRFVIDCQQMAESPTA